MSEAIQRNLNSKFNPNLALNDFLNFRLRRAFLVRGRARFLGDATLPLTNPHPCKTLEVAKFKASL
ncbi:hypothetical protein OFO12_07590 [Campylobacter sp. JMF_04 NA10]|uniref:hypothetical protein n=1 Tax=Campylobacter sp. JMF_04 NA10 TaxID=2983824 RepID=UPI0022E9F948|nr:hypothetical protein [Campylobacter sp. JMF_04 NA10]MDA3077217.1 hypothetical protein [Campylobacter sp. JMF_04 NA10]